MIVSSPKKYVFATILSLVLLGTLSFGSFVGMERDEHGQMSACPFTATSSICTMSFSEHLSSWQGMFAATVDNSARLLAVVGFMLLVVVLASEYLKADRYKDSHAYKYYAHERQKTFTSNKLLELFSRGILNPKIYELAVI